MLATTIMAPDIVRSQFQIVSINLYDHQVVNGAFRSVYSINLAYQALNTIEGIAWIILGVLVIKRSKWLHTTLLEITYALAFIFFGVSDFIEVNSYPLWLAFWKLFNVLILLYLRSIVIRVYYPESRVY